MHKIHAFFSRQHKDTPIYSSEKGRAISIISIISVKKEHTHPYTPKSENEILLYIYINIFIYIYNRSYFYTFRGMNICMSIFL